MRVSRGRQFLIVNPWRRSGFSIKGPKSACPISQSVPVILNFCLPGLGTRGVLPGARTLQSIVPAVVFTALGTPARPGPESVEMGCHKETGDGLESMSLQTANGCMRSFRPKNLAYIVPMTEVIPGR